MSETYRRVRVAEAQAREGTGEVGVCYMLHFDPDYKGAGRYMGWTRVGDGETPLQAVLRRYAQHVAGHGSPLVRAAVEAGYCVVIARVWQDVDRHFERRCKSGRNLRRLDPISRGEMTLAEAVEQHHVAPAA